MNAGGDGLDSNGSITINGGVIYVDGPTNAGNAALDMGTEMLVNGGTVVAAGSTGMDEYSRIFGIADVPLPDGIYDGTVVTEQTHPISFLFESR